MKASKTMNNSRVYGLILILAFQFITTVDLFSQYPGINDDITKLRKGELLVKAKPGDKVVVEQLRHEFWFGCAISNGLASERMPAEDKKQYKEKFLENFNSAVTENAVKWPDMERNRGEVNYSTVDGILKWTEENNIPLRGHNIFWGIPNRVQPWLRSGCYLSREYLSPVLVCRGICMPNHSTVSSSWMRLIHWQNSNCL